MTLNYSKTGFGGPEIDLLERDTEDYFSSDCYETENFMITYSRNTITPIQFV